MSERLTKQQEKILDFIKLEVKDKGYPPSVREICDGVGLKSTSTVHGHLTRLEKKGFIRRDSTKPRAIEIISFEDDLVVRNKAVTHIPIIGKVTAGSPILAVQDVQETFPVPSSYIDSGTYFMLRVQGESMINKGIYDQDIVMVKQQTTADNGETVVALIDDSATVKTFYKEENHIRLQPENDFMEPIIVKDVRILGIVKGVFRML